MRNEFSCPPSHLCPKKPIIEWGGAENFKGLSQDGGRVKFAENLRASPFNDDLSNDTTFSQIYLAGQGV
jgi:hypothetical protein